MNMHKNARLTPKGREILIGRLERGEHACDVARALGVSERTGRQVARSLCVPGVG